MSETTETQAAKALRIQQVAEASGVSAKMIRHYETLGLVKPQRAVNKYRLYSSCDVEVLKAIRDLRTLAFSLREVKALLPVLVDTPDTPDSAVQMGRDIMVQLDERTAAGQRIQAMYSARREARHHPARLRGRGSRAARGVRSPGGLRPGGGAVPGAGRRAARRGGCRPMTPRQVELARHALGLARGPSCSYRNHFYASEGHADFPDWMEMVADGMAKRAAVRGKGPLEERGYFVFSLTRAGAEAALRPGERLCPEDFPPEVHHAA